MKLSRYAVFTIILIIVLLSGCSPVVDSGASRIEKGVLDLTAWDFKSDGNIILDGEWEFYWNKLLTYGTMGSEAPDLYAQIPSNWNAYLLNGANLPGEGYATYRLHVKTSLPKGTMLGFRTNVFSSAFNLYVNDELTASSGRVATTAGEETGEYRTQAVVFSIPASEFDVIVHVSNFHYARGGFWYSIYMGSAENIQNYHDGIMGKEVFLLGALLIIALFYFAIYILRRELRYTLYFAMLCISIAIGIDLVGQLIFVRVFPGISFNTLIFIWYFSAALNVSLLIMYVHELYPSRFSNAARKVFLCNSLFWLGFCLFTPPLFYTRFGQVSNYVEIAGYLCTVIIVAIGLRAGNRNGWLNVVSMVVVLTTYIHDVLYWTNVIKNNFGEMFYVGLFLFIFIQMVIQAKRIKLFYENETAAELSFLQAQIKPHFLYNTLNTFVAISYYDTDKARGLLTEFSNYLRRSFDFKNLSQFVPLKNEIELAKAYAEIEKARFEERLEIIFDALEDMEVNVPTLMLQPLIENAVIHGILPKPEGGRIEISIRKETKYLVFRVKDNGIGMDAKKLHDVLQQKTKRGIGVGNIDKRLKKLYGKGLDIKSSPGVGTDITWIIPVNSREK
ncbi:MAG TPA: histidine kinase [Clostridia bacterium]|nr:histidine kinase [Clostridia bacterium]